MKTVKTILLLSVFIAAIFIPVSVLASDISLSAEPAQVITGDTVTVTVTVSGEDIAVAQGVFEYDYTVLSYDSSTGGAADGQLNMISLEAGGASSLTAVIKFTAIGAGDGTVRFSINSILDYDGNALSSAEDSVDIAVFASSAEILTGDDAEVIPPFTLDGIAAANVVGTEVPLYVWRSVMNLTLPSGFADTEVRYSGETIGGAVSASNNTVLLYLSDESGENAAFYVFDEENNAFYPYASVRSASQTFTFLWPDAAVTVPDGYTDTTLDVDGQTVPAWIAEDPDTGAYLVYVIDGVGEKAIYQYIPDDQSLQRYIAPSPAQAAAASSPIDKNVFLALCVVCGLLFVSVVVLLILYFSEQKEKREVIAFSKKRINELQNKE